jgi:hypothetical protein
MAVEVVEMKLGWDEVGGGGEEQVTRRAWAMMSLLACLCLARRGK